jgi:formamidopyrimidine-DNA glycosylase
VPVCIPDSNSQFQNWSHAIPELPEAETIARGLASTIVGKTIAGARALRPEIVIAARRPAFGKQLAGDRITRVGRRGKYPIVELASGRTLVVSLRMTGRLIVQRQTDALYPYTNVIIDFTDGTRLAFADVRRFGRMRLVQKDEIWDAELGVEPLSQEFDIPRFAAILKGRPTPIKAFLLDQRRIAGVGNIYAVEALWESQIKPSTPAGKLSRERIGRLHGALQAVLRKAIEMRGTSSRDYVDAEGMEGGFQNELTVYGRAGEPCPRCKKPLVRTVLAQRGTWWCRNCQR